MKESNHLEELLKKNWESIKRCKTPIDQIVLSIIWFIKMK